MSGTLKIQNKKVYYLLIILLVLFGGGIISIFFAETGKEIFYSYLLLSSSFAGAAFILMLNYSISYHGISQKEIIKTFSGIYLSLAMLIWALRGAAFFLFQISTASIDSFDLLEPIFSTINSTFFILAMKDIFFQEVDIPKWRKWKVVTLLRKDLFVWMFSFIAMICMVSMPYLFKKDMNLIKRVPDFIFGTITITYIAATLSHAFKVRGLKSFQVLVYASLSITFLAQLFNLLGSDWEFLSVKYFYTGSMEILLFGLLVSYHSYLSLLREQQQKSDMNHAIRNGLFDLRYDISRGGRQEHDATLLDILYRIKALETLHNHLHSQKNTEIYLSNYLKVLSINFARARALDETQMEYKINLPTEWHTKYPDIARKLGRIVVELNTNAYQAMKKNNQVINIKNHFYVERNTLMIIEIEDRGPGFKYDKGSLLLGFGLRNVQDLVEDDLEGTISIEPIKGGGSLAKIILPIYKLLLA